MRSQNTAVTFDGDHKCFVIDKSLRRGLSESAADAGCVLGYGYFDNVGAACEADEIRGLPCG